MSNHSQRSKQTPQTARKARELRRLKAEGKTWEKASIEVGILTEAGKPDPGLAYKIAMEGYEPKGQDLRDRLGLKKFCTACMRGFRKVSRSGGELSPWRKFWRRLSPGERDRRIRDIWEKEKE